MDVKNKTIAVLCNYVLLPERVGGMDYFFWAFNAKCKSEGYEIDWFFPNQANHGDYTKLHILSSDGTTVESFFLNYLTDSKKHYTHIVTHFLELCTPFFYKVKRIISAKIIAVDHNPRPINGYPLKKRIQKKIKGFLFSGVTDVFIGVSNYTVNAILTDFGSHLQTKTKTIYNGILLDTILVREKRNNICPAFIVVSHLRESKGIQDLIEAVALLPNEIKDKIVIDIYGDGPYKPTLLEIIDRRRLGNNFNFKGSKSNLKTLLFKYDYMLQPTHMECFSLSILESLAANVPVITTRVGGNAEVITHGQNGFLFEAKDHFTLSQIIEEIFLGNQKILINTREFIVNSFPLQKMVENHFELIQ